MKAFPGNIISMLWLQQFLFLFQIYSFNLTLIQKPVRFYLSVWLHCLETAHSLTDTTSVVIQGVLIIIALPEMKE